MFTFESIDESDLDRISGGQQRSTSAEGTISTPGGSATVRAGQSTQEPNAYLRCLDLVGRQGGMMESPNNVERRQQALCPPLLNQPQQ